MIDLHSHIIPNVDDGSRSVEETFNMILEAKKVGFTDIITTSHYLTNHYEPTVSELEFWNEKLQEVLYNKNIDINLHSGMEVYISNSVREMLEKSKVLTLANSNYMLFELPLLTNVTYLDYFVSYLQSNSIQPIMAHPERYKCVQENPYLVAEYIEKGILMQCNYGSILELYGGKAKKTMKELLKNDMVNFLGSDCHKENTIYNLIPFAVKKIKKIVGEKNFYKMSTENPKKVLNNEKWDWE